MNDSKDLGPLPEPVIEDKEPNPGGADAVPESPDEGLARDLDPADNPAVEDVLPEQIAELDADKQQEPDAAHDESADQEANTPEAGQQAEDGSVEPPA
jgi:hypothetical protein